MSELAIQVDGFSFAIGRKTILNRVSFAVESGEYVSIVGPNGAGKSTLLKCLNRIYTGGAGTVRILGRDLHRYSQRMLARTLAYVPQADSSRHPFTVSELILMGRYPHLSPFTSPGAADRKAVHDAMESTHTLQFAERWHSTLSGGESQKVLIAAALAQEASVLLLDEPTTFLDPHHQEEILHILKRINRDKGVTILCVTHDVNQAALFSSRVIALSEGTVQFSGKPEDVMNNEKLGTLFGQEFLFVDHPTAGLPIVLPREAGEGEEEKLKCGKLKAESGETNGHKRHKRHKRGEGKRLECRDDEMPTS